MRGYCALGALALLKYMGVLITRPRFSSCGLVLACAWFVGADGVRDVLCIRVVLCIRDVLRFRGLALRAPAL